MAAALRPRRPASLCGLRAPDRRPVDRYLGVRAGGTLRKRRRGEPLMPDEEEALGRWQRLSAWRKESPSAALPSARSASVSRSAAWSSAAGAGLGTDTAAASRRFRALE